MNVGRRPVAFGPGQLDDLERVVGLLGRETAR
jgi:hypothetical protein